MKTRILVLGLAVAALSVLSVKVSKAQNLAEPAVKVLNANQNQLKVIYGYSSSQEVEVKFVGSEGIIETDRISGKDFGAGFIKKYDVRKLKGKAFSVEIDSKELSVTYKLTPAKDGKWLAQLEKTTFNYPVVASN